MRSKVDLSSKIKKKRGSQLEKEYPWLKQQREKRKVVVGKSRMAKTLLTIKSNVEILSSARSDYGIHTKETKDNPF